MYPLSLASSEEFEFVKFGDKYVVKIVVHKILVEYFCGGIKYTLCLLLCFTSRLLCCTQLGVFKGSSNLHAIYPVFS